MFWFGRVWWFWLVWVPLCLEVNEMRSWKDKQREQVKGSIADAMAAHPIIHPMTANNEQGESFEEWWVDNGSYSNVSRACAKGAWNNRTEHYQKLLAEKDAVLRAYKHNLYISETTCIQN